MSSITIRWFTSAETFHDFFANLKEDLAGVYQRQTPARPLFSVITGMCQMSDNNRHSGDVDFQWGDKYTIER
jgi:hypothetical protein